MKIKNKIYIRIRFVMIGVYALFLIVSVGSCKTYLDEKPDQSITTPSTVEDLEQILNSFATINSRYPSASEVSSDDFYLTATEWNALADAQRSYFVWQKYSEAVGDYTSPYIAIEYSNVILDALKLNMTGDPTRLKIVEGNAYFIRAAYHFALAQLFAAPYDQASAKSDLGIALRLTSDVAVRPVRANLEETYQQVISDLRLSINMLPSNPDLKYRASKPAAYGMLSRVYLSMRDYDNAGLYADSALTLYNKLIDYNTLSATAAIPFKQFNDEVIYDARTSAPAALLQTRAKIDTLLFASYTTNDLRRTVLFKTNTNGTRAFKGNYTGLSTASLFTGIATNELYVTSAEAAVRNGNITQALNMINILLRTRWKTGTFIPVSVTNQKELLKLVLTERRKDLLFRSLRWIDLRRLNKEEEFKRTISRNLGGTVYSLEPNSLRYIFQISKDAVIISGLPQNP